MAEKRKMPKKADILKYWAGKLYDMPEDMDAAERRTWLETCWACGFPGILERCHIKARIQGGTDTVDNLMLLCRHCHNLQETRCMTEEGRQAFVEAMKYDAPYMALRFKQLSSIAEQMTDAERQAILERRTN